MTEDWVGGMGKGWAWELRDHHAIVGIREECMRNP